MMPKPKNRPGRSTLIGGVSLIQENADMAGIQPQASEVDPAKWLAIVRAWVPAERLETIVALINSVIEASGPARVEGLDALIAHIDGTTRSGREKFERLRQWSDKMRADPRYWPQLFVRPRAVSILIKAILDKSSRPLNRFEVERKFRKVRKVPRSGLSQELKEMAKRGEIDRIAAGLYWRKGTAVKVYESQARQLYRLVHDAPSHRMPNAELADAMNIGRKYLEMVLSQMRKRWCDPPLFEDATGDGVVVVSAESLAVLKRDGQIVDGRGGTFFSTPGLVARTEPVTFTTLRAERPPVDLDKLALQIRRLKGLKRNQQDVEFDPVAKDLGVPRMLLELMVRPTAQVVKHKERKAIGEAAKEKWRAEYRVLASDLKGLPNRKKLWEAARRVISGLTRQMFREVISEEGPGKSGRRGNRAKKSEKHCSISA
jgi:hypothetical protein